MTLAPFESLRACWPDYALVVVSIRALRAFRLIGALRLLGAIRPLLTVRAIYAGRPYGYFILVSLGALRALRLVDVEIDLHVAEGSSGASNGSRCFVEFVSIRILRWRLFVLHVFTYLLLVVITNGAAAGPAIASNQTMRDIVMRYTDAECDVDDC